MLLELAWTNILSQPRRSLVTTLLLCVATTTLIFAGAFMDGSHQQMIDNAVELYPGHVQVTAPGYRDQPSLDRLIFNLEEQRRAVNEQPGIAATTSRYEAFVLLAAGEQAVGARLTAIEPTQEAKISRLQQSLVSGRFLQDNDAGAIYLGLELARRLLVDVGDRLAYVGSGADGSFAADRLQVVGLFQTGLFEFDNSSAFAARAALVPAMALDDIASHLVILPHKPTQAEALAGHLQETLGPAALVESWQQSMAGLVEAMAVDSLFGYLTLGVLFLVIVFVITIYTTLAVMARTRELGLLRAMGFGQGRVVALLTLEGLVLILSGVCAGALIGGSLAYTFQLHPISFTQWEEQFRQYNLVASALPARFSLAQILRDMVIMMTTGLLAMLPPLLRAGRLTPVEALGHV